MIRIVCLFFCCCCCRMIVPAQAFTEVSNQAGLTYIYPGNDNQEVGSGVVVLDVNNDGWDDFFQAGGVFPSKLWINQKGIFTDGTSLYKLELLKGLYIQGGAAADFNNDGFEDLFLCNFGKGMRHGDNQNPLLLMNVKGRYFQPVLTTTFSLPGNYTSCAWGDYNNDGFVDLYITDYIHRMHNLRDSSGQATGYNPDCNENKFYINTGGRHFKEAAKQFGLNNNGCGLACMFTDYDQDGDADLLLLNDFGEWNHKGNQLFRNDYPKNRFTEISQAAGFYNEIYGMGIGAGDIDNDGDLDYYVTNIGQNFLYLNNKGQLTDIARETGVDNTFVTDSIRGAAWSGLFFDMNNDGLQDLYVTKGKLETLTPPTVVKDPNKLYLNKGAAVFEDISAWSGVDDVLSHRGAALIDYDHDGDLDIISSVIKLHWSDLGGLDQKLKLFRNDQPTKNNWIGIKLKGEGRINSSCMGASITLKSGGMLQVKEVDGGSGHGSQSTRTLYFGLGKATVIDRIVINWPGGRTKQLTNLKPGNVYEINTSGKKRVIY